MCNEIVAVDYASIEARAITFYLENNVDKKLHLGSIMAALAIGHGSGDLVELNPATKARSRERQAPRASSGLHKNHSADEYRRQAVANSVNGCGPRIRRARDAWIKKIEEETGRRLTKEERGRAINNFNAMKPYQGIR